MARGSAEHEMFKEMRVTGFAGFHFVAGSGMDDYV
jgi:hypothetical protein